MQRCPHDQCQSGHRKQSGVALMVMLVIIIMGSLAFLLSSLNRSNHNTERDQKTADALMQAKEALIAYTISMQLISSGSERLGDLPCPDLLNDGKASFFACGNAAGTTGQSARLGRLPWATLKLGDIRDGSGERLWYAVSNNFKKNYPTPLLNSDTVGTINIRNADGSVQYDGGTGNGVVAVIIAPGAALQRADKSTLQDRSSSGENNPLNYLDILSGVEDNADFIDTSSNGFIQGKVRDDNGKLVLNDQLLVITTDDIISAMQKRVAAEVKNCLDEYAINYNGRYPWAAKVSDTGSTYSDSKNEYFGRIPDDLSKSKNDIGVALSFRWGDTCNTHNYTAASPWWKNWKEQVFYGIAKKFAPDNTPAPVFPATCASAGNCLNINNTGTPARYVIMVAGKKLATPSQALRSSNKSNPFYYLEGGNENADQTGAYTYTQQPMTSTFNDVLIYQ